MYEFEEVVILLVEDDLGDQKLVAKALAKERIANKLRITSSGEEALQYLDRSKAGDKDSPMPDLILLDLNMPGIGGQEFLRLLKSDHELTTIPVVILTTSDSDRDILESFKLQASGYIKKPGSLEAFHQIMHDVTDYWFVICKRVHHDSGCKKRDTTCSVG